MSALQEFGIDLIVMMQQLSPALDGIMSFFTFFGTVEFYMILIPAVYWTLNKRWGLRAFLILLFTDFVGSAFKLYLHQPRPYWISENVRLLQAKEELSYGIISTHASDPPAVLGYLALKFKKQWLWGVAVAVPLLISYSRMHLGVHFPHDVAAGWIAGLLVLFIFVKLEERVSVGLEGRSIGYRLGAAFAASMGYVIVALLVSAAIASSPDPAGYAAYTEEARSLNHFFTLAGSMFGAMAGWTLMKSYAPFSEAGPLAQKFARYLLGLAGIVVVLYGLDFVFDAVQAGEIVAYSLRYVRYGLTSLWAIFGAPWLFLKLKLAQPA